MDETLARRHLVLLGIGHTNAHIVKMWRMNPIPDTDLTCISNYPYATYSGMLPAVLAGQNTVAEMQIDLVKLCAAAGARLILNPVSGLNHQSNEVLFEDRPPVPYDALSIGIGSVPTIDNVKVSGSSLIQIKPMQTFLDRLESKYVHISHSLPGETIQVCVVGAGVAGVEVAFCVGNFLREKNLSKFQIRLLTRGPSILPEALGSTRRRAMAGFHRKKIDVQCNANVVSVRDNEIQLADDTTVPANLIIWATGATSPSFLSRLDLPTDDRGFLLVKPTLQTVGEQPVFAVGDTGTIKSQPLPKAGVYAVRQGPILWKNLHRILEAQPLVEYHPQRSFLSLINKGDGTAIGQWKGRSFEGKWVMRLKDRIDSRFMEMFRPDPMQGDEDDMQCRGCGCKLAAGDLESVVGNLDGIQLEDAAEIKLVDGSDSPTVASTDFFTSPFRDAFLSGRIAALHSASDIICSGATVKSALANVVLPEGDPKSQRRALSDFLQGAQLEFDAMGAKIVGGHTIVGPRMEIGFTVIGSSSGPELIRKRHLQVGDSLVLTKALGIGICLAAHMRGACTAVAYTSMLDEMLERQHELAKLAADFGIRAGTDITGFGLAGHLMEMLTTSDVSAMVHLESLRAIPGTNDFLEQGIQSTLAPSNRINERYLHVADQQLYEHPKYPLLFDPQTCGGMLLGISQSAVDEFCNEAESRGFKRPHPIGQVTGKGEKSKIQLER